MQQPLTKNAEVVVSKTHHDDYCYDRLSCSLMQAVGDVIGVDPSEQRLHLEDYIYPDHLDQGWVMEMPEASEALVRFEYGGYMVECNFDGTITITANREGYEAGEVTLPASMRSS